MIKEILLILMPGVVSMLVWRKMHPGTAFSGFDYLEGVALFDIVIYLFNVFLVWSRNWEAIDVAGFGCSGSFKYAASSLVFAVAVPVIAAKLLEVFRPKK